MVATTPMAGACPTMAVTTRRRCRLTSIRSVSAAETVDQPLWMIWQWDFASRLATGAGTALLGSGTTPAGGGPYIGDYRWYSGYGGGVFVDQRSKAEFVECTIRGNRTDGGMTGQGGAGDGGRNIEPLIPFEVPSFGGGVYVAADAVVTFTNCSFENNLASPRLTGEDPNFRLDPYIGHGGGVAAERTASVRFVDCNFVDNAADTGGGLYIADGVATVVDCNIASNVSLRGAGLAGTGGAIRVEHSDVRGNEAITDVNDPNDDAIPPLGAGLFFWSTSAQIIDCNIASNTSFGSGGGIYLRGENNTTVDNCLIVNNVGYRDGGGLATVWYATPTVQNCTFVGNSSPAWPTSRTSPASAAPFPAVTRANSPSSIRSFGRTTPDWAPNWRWQRLQA